MISFQPAEAQINSDLYVSAENPAFGNKISGPQVIEVVIRDQNIGDTGKGLGEPDVTINGKDLRMVQATDGNWYGYFADRKQAQIADSTVGLTGKGLDFGTFCSRNTPVLGVAVSDSEGIAIPVSGSGIGPKLVFDSVDEINLATRAKIDTFMENAKTTAAKNGIVFESEIILGSTEKDILDYANRWNFDLIVIGSRGAGSSDESYLGSIANHILHKSSIPVLVVK